MRYGYFVTVTQPDRGDDHRICVAMTST